MPDNKPSKYRRKRRFRGGDIVLFILIAIIALVFVIFDFNDIVALLYSPISGLILVIMLLELLLLKSSDRTRIYSLEIDRLRKQRRRDEELLRRAQSLTLQALGSPDSEEAGRPGDWHLKATELAKDIERRL